jgi:hypothetical protein
MNKEGSRSPFPGSKPAISTSPCAGRLKVKEWLKDRQPKLLTGRPLDKLSRGILDYRNNAGW